MCVSLRLNNDSCDLRQMLCISFQSLYMSLLLVYMDRCGLSNTCTANHKFLLKEINYKGYAVLLVNL